MILKRDQLFTVVCNIRTPQPDNKVLLGTGSFVSKEDKVYLLTAEHVSKKVSSSTILAFGDNQSKCIKVLLSDLISNGTWKKHPVADMAIIELDISKHPNLFVHRCYPYDHINQDVIAPSRDDELTVIGFPHGLGIQGKFSPLTFRSYAASSLLTLDRFDTQTPCDFFCLENPSTGGYSGGPVFDLGYEILGSLTSNKGNTVMHGIVHGTTTDDTGGKLALITPMYYIKDLI